MSFLRAEIGADDGITRSYFYSVIQSGKAIELFRPVEK